MPRLTGVVPVPVVVCSLVTAPFYGGLWTASDGFRPARLASINHVTHNEGVIHLDVDTIATLVVLVTTILGSHTVLRRELKADIKDVRAEIKDVRNEIKDVRDDVRRLDDRVYQLAVGLKPLVEQAERHS